MNEQGSFAGMKEKVNERMGQVKKEIMVMSGKGGVGKTTIAVNLAIALKAKGFKVGLLDLDIHGPNVPKMLGIGQEKLATNENEIMPIILKNGLAKGLKVMSMGFLLEEDAPVIWRGPLKMRAISQFLGDVKWEKLDFLIIDLPPGTGDEPLSMAQLVPQVEGSVIVTTPQEVALIDSRRAVNFSKKLNIPILGIVENMSGLACPHCGKEIKLFKVGGGKKAAEELKVPFLGKISLDPKIVEASDSGELLILKYPNSKTGREFKEIVDKINTKQEVNKNAR